MDITKYYKKDGEKPLDEIKDDGGFCAIFRTIACVGDSLSSGEFQSYRASDELVGYHDMFEYSWGQYMARAMGSKVYNFSRGGMSAKEYCESFAASMDFWDVKKCAQCYIFALGVNDVSAMLAGNLEMGDISDIDLNNYENNKKTFAGYYGKIIQKYKEIQPKAKFFLMTMPKGRVSSGERAKLEDEHRELLYKMAELFDYTYVLDFREYSPAHDEEFFKYFMLDGHMSPAGYLLTAKMTMSYIDYIIRNNPEDFIQVGFIGTPWHNERNKW